MKLLAVNWIFWYVIYYKHQQAGEEKKKKEVKTTNPYSLVILFSSTEAAVGKGVRFYVCFNCTLHLFGHGTGGFLCHTASRRD